MRLGLVALTRITHGYSFRCVILQHVLPPSNRTG